ncbi:hypothetical protein OCK74_05840 [Chitinophagaceae bacterium LB-8]|uniref:Uncharacterized protein n=1 Tax=Paraflavisolibacter caeni TaxID=2982496 RepID=A0A9X2XVV1_9BACT|nr:hypothetical protein [Paraflavisolibacter caeni]MCU7548628.1 hypothetical protein [Paraflavisolibacter caeni]
MTNSTIANNQVREHFPSAPKGIVINTTRTTKTTEAPKIVQNVEMNYQKISERERMNWIEQKLSQRSYVSGYKGL